MFSSFKLIVWIIYFRQLTNSLPLQANFLQNYLFEGDIAGVKLRNKSQDSKGVAQLEYQDYGLWTNGIVPYTIDNNFKSSDVSIIKEGMNLIESQTCIKFVTRTNQKTWLRIQNVKYSGCWSMVGQQKWDGEQTLSLESPYCVYKGQVAHELMHALGFWHEQSRPDRDNFVNVIWDNIRDDYYSQFQKYDTNYVTTQGFPYDYDSIMHYGPAEFTQNGQPTVKPIQSGVTLKYAYEKNYISNIDIKEINKFYNCAK